MGDQPMTTENKSYPLLRRRRNAIVRFLPLLLAVMMFFLTTQPIYGAVPLTTGSSTVGNTLQYGNTSYTISYSYPSTVQVGTNMNLTFNVRVNSLTGLIEYTTTYSLSIVVSVGTNELTGNITAPNGSPFLYPGSNWGPNNVTIPLTAANTGLAKGQSANASVSVVLNDWNWVGGAVTYYSTEPPMTGNGGSFVIQNAVQTASSASGSGSGGTDTTTTTTTSQGASASQGYLPYVLLGIGAVLMIAAVITPRSPKSIVVPAPQT
jgi:hypothetical protein